MQSRAVKTFQVPCDQYFDYMSVSGDSSSPQYNSVYNYNRDRDRQYDPDSNVYIAGLPRYVYK